MDGYNAPVSRGEVYYLVTAMMTGEDAPQKGKPVVVVSSNDMNQRSAIFYVASMTQNPKVGNTDDYHFDIKSGKFRGSTLCCDRIQYVTSARLGDYIETLSDIDIEEIDANLERLFDVCHGQAKPKTESVGDIEELFTAKERLKELENEAGELHGLVNEYSSELTRLEGNVNQLKDKLSIESAEALSNKTKQEVYEKLYHDLLGKVIKI